MTRTNRAPPSSRISRDWEGAMMYSSDLAY
jgi:hypothetical protein